MNEQTSDVERTERTNAIQSTRLGSQLSSRRTVLASVVGIGAFTAVNGTVTADEPPTVEVEFTDTDIDVGETTEATVSISEIPSGLSGLLGDATVTDSSVAEITDVSFPDDWGLTQDPEISADGSSVNLVTADIDGNYSEGDTDVELCTLELEGVDDGETTLEFEDLIEDADANFYDFDLDSPSLSVGEGESGSKSGNGNSDDGSSMPGFGVGAAIAGVGSGVAYLVRDRASGDGESR